MAKQPDNSDFFEKLKMVEDFSDEVERVDGKDVVQDAQLTAPHSLAPEQGVVLSDTDEEAMQEDYYSQVRQKQAGLNQAALARYMRDFLKSIWKT